MTELKNVQELLQTDIGTEGQLLIPRKIHDQLIQEVDKNLLSRELAAIVDGPEQIPGSSMDYDLETADSMAVRPVGEGAEIPLDNSEYSSFNNKPVKYGVAIRITRELMEDSKWNLLQRNIAIAGKRFAENETSLIISQSLDNANSTTAGGAAATIANITESMQDLEDEDYDPTDLIVGNEFLNDLRNIDTFVEADKSGSTEMLMTGFRGVIYGMRVHKVSSNAGMTTTTAYVMDRAHAYVITEKRRITTEGFELATFDMSGSVCTQRIVTRYIRSKAISKITTS